MYVHTSDDIFKYLENWDGSKGFEFLDEIYQRQPIFKEFLSENFEKVINENVYLFLLQVCAQFFDMIQRKNPNLPVICEESIAEYFKINFALGVRTKDSENREAIFEYVIAHHKYEKLLRMAIWASKNYLNDFFKDTGNKQESIYKLSVLCFIILKTLVEACHKDVEALIRKN